MSGDYILNGTDGEILIPLSKIRVEAGTKPDLQPLKEELNELLKNPILLLEVGELFLAEQSTYEPSGLIDYLFTGVSVPADGTDGQCLAFRHRNQTERNSVLLAPSEYGLVRRHAEVSPQ